jgi:hypothetical protein
MNLLWLLEFLKTIFLVWEVKNYFSHKRKFESLEEKFTDLNQRLECLEEETKKLKS